ncbi:MAG: hypothetical protein NWQ54_11745 [Paraglaciecola sp.]|nr:hypothetical protein [Paraglaciecola sp.]
MVLEVPHFKVYSLCFLVGAYLSTNLSYAGELTVKKALDTSANIYQTQRANEKTEDAYAATLNPSLVSVYKSKVLTGDFAINHSQIKQGGYEDATSRSFTDFRLNSNTSIIENLMSLALKADQNYRPSNQSDGFIVDRLLSTGELSKTDKYSAILNFAMPNPEYVGLDWQALYSKSTADNSIDDGPSLNSSNKGLTLRVYNGRNLRRIGFNLSAQQNDTARRNNQNFKSTILNGNINFGLFNDLSFVLTGSDTTYDLSSETQVANPRNIDTTSYGAGLKWSPSNNRFIEITFNNLEQELQKTEYIGVSSNWAFTNRTSLALNYGKRFYGDAYSAKFTYNLKSLRSSMSYSEDVTSFSRLSVTEESLGVFVCPIGSTDLLDCFQPNDLSYELQPGEEFINFNSIVNDLTDEVILNKTAQATIGYSLKKLKVSINYRYTDTEYLESQRSRKNQSISINSNYQLSKTTNISLNSSLSKIENKTTVDEDSITITVSLKKSLSQNLVVNSSFRYLDRSSEQVIRDLTDKRLTLGFTYSF